MSAETEEGCVFKQREPSVRKNGREYVCRHGRGLCNRTRCTFSLYIWKRIMSAKMEEGCIFHQAKAHLLSLEEEEDVLQTRAIAIFSNKVITIFPNY